MRYQSPLPCGACGAQEAFPCIRRAEGPLPAAPPFARSSAAAGVCRSVLVVLQQLVVDPSQPKDKATARRELQLLHTYLHKYPVLSPYVDSIRQYTAWLRALLKADPAVPQVCAPWLRCQGWM